MAAREVIQASVQIAELMLEREPTLHLRDQLRARRRPVGVDVAPRTPEASPAAGDGDGLHFGDARRRRFFVGAFVGALLGRSGSAPHRQARHPGGHRCASRASEGAAFVLAGDPASTAQRHSQGHLTKEPTVE